MATNGAETNWKLNLARTVDHCFQACQTELRGHSTCATARSLIRCGQHRLLLIGDDADADDEAADFLID